MWEAAGYIAFFAVKTDRQDFEVSPSLLFACEKTMSISRTISSPSICSSLHTCDSDIQTEVPRISPWPNEFVVNRHLTQPSFVFERFDWWKKTDSRPMAQGLKKAGKGKARSRKRGRDGKIKGRVKGKTVGATTKPGFKARILQCWFLLRIIP